MSMSSPCNGLGQAYTVLRGSVRVLPGAWSEGLEVVVMIRLWDLQQLLYLTFLQL